MYKDNINLLIKGEIMFKLFRNGPKAKVKTQMGSGLLSPNDFRKELDEKFSDYDYFDLSGELAFDECFMFIYRNIKDLKDTLIIAAILRQIEPTIDAVKDVYSLDGGYVNRVVSEKIPKLKVLVYKRLEELPNEKVAFFPGFHNNFEPLYKDLIDRMEYLFEVKRNTQKLFSEFSVSAFYSRLTDNSSFLFLLNYLSVRDALIVAVSLDIVDISDEEIQSIYPYDSDYFETMFNKNVAWIKSSLSDRIKKLEIMEPETSHFNYDGLCSQYKDLEQRINDTIDYLRKRSKRR